jgi:hypothetical protein
VHKSKKATPISQSKGSQAKALAQMHNPKNPSPISQSKGSQANDYLDGGFNNDILYGGSGNDSITSFGFGQNEFTRQRQ